MSATQQPSPVIGLVGTGLLRAAVERLLAGRYPVVALDRVEAEADAPPCGLLIALDDRWSPQRARQLNRASLHHALPCLHASVAFGRGIVGPLVEPGTSGCATCAEQRHVAAQEHRDAYLQLRDGWDDERASALPTWLTSASVDLLAHLIIEEIDRFSAGDTPRTRNAQLHVALDTLMPQLHRFLPDPHCADCGWLPDDSARTAQITLQPRPKLGPRSYRVRSLIAEKQRLLDRYVDSEVGMIYALVKDVGSLYANFSAKIRLPNTTGIETGFGRTLSYDLSLLAGVAEAVERYGGMRPGGKRTVVQASYNQLGAQALDPTTLGLHTPEQHARPDFPYPPFDPDRTYGWVWGYSFRRQQPILVPERYAYYGMRYCSAGQRSFVYEISNGCALGGCLEEAILYGLLEVAERDAFLMTWYARLGVPRIDPWSTGDSTVGLLLERLEHLTGYTVHAFNITMEQQIPCFWVMAVDEQDRPGMPKALCAAGSHLDPVQALTNALHELAPSVNHMPRRYAAERAHAAALAADSFAVRQMSDHPLLYCVPETFERLQFLYQTPRQQRFAEAFAAVPPQLDLRVDLERTINRYLGSGLDVIVVDQTTPEHAAADLSCVKVIVPGTLPMTFGQHFRRYHGFERLRRVPVELGYRATPPSEAEINPHPHPFP